MAKAELFVLVLLSLSFAYIDPPVEEVHNYNIGIAPSGVLGSNVLLQPERTPTLNNPTTFFYVEILTLTPSVNESITGSVDPHPQLVWLVAEHHVSSITELNGHTQFDDEITITQYEQPVITWTVEETGEGEEIIVAALFAGDDVEFSSYGSGITLTPHIEWEDSEPEVTEPEPPPEDDCEKIEITRNYESLEIDEVNAHYVLSGILHNDNGNYTYETAVEDRLLADNTTFDNPSDVPFDTSLTCSFLAFLGDYMLGGMINLDCNEESLARASPYATGVYNLTVRNLTVVDPKLDVTINGVFKINYTEYGEICHEDEEEGCECDDWETEGTLTISDGDSASYEVQNDYMSIIPYSPGFLDLNGNTSENVIYYFSLLSNSELYKYYSRMDGNTSTAFYVHNFSVVSDPYGTQFIIAHKLNHSELLPYDPEVTNNYTGPRRLLLSKHGVELRSPTEITTMSYNYSRVYNFKEVFYNLSPGPHHVDLEFYTWWGEYSDSSDIYARNTTTLTLSSHSPSETEMIASCRLTNKGGMPIAGAKIEISFGDQVQRVATNSMGICEATFRTDNGVGVMTAEFEGTDAFLPSSTIHIASSNTAFSIGDDLVIDNLGLMILLSMLVAVAFLNITSVGATAAVTMGAALGKVFPFAGKGGPPIRLYRVKKGKELVISVAGALAGGAGAAAGSAAAGKMAADAAAKKMAVRKAEEKAFRKKVIAAGKKKKKKDELSSKKKKKAASEEKLRKKQNKEYRFALNPTQEEMEEIDKKLKRIDASHKKMRESEKKVSKELREKAHKMFNQVREEEIEHLKEILRINPEDKKILERSIMRIQNTDMYVVDIETWKKEIPNCSRANPETAESFYYKHDHEIFLREDMAKDPKKLEMVMGHEIDHALCKYEGKTAREGHADLRSFERMMAKGIDVNQDSILYQNRADAYAVIRDLAGEDAINNHSAYVGGNMELIDKIWNRYESNLVEHNISKERLALRVEEVLMLESKPSIARAKAIRLHRILEYWKTGKIR